MNVHLSSVLANNACAIVYIKQNDYVTATKNLHSALDQIYAYIIPGSVIGASDDVPNRLVANIRPDDACVRVQDTGDIIVRKGFTIQNALGDTSPILSDQDTNLLTVALLFNLGLCYHLSAVSITQSHDFHYFRIALSVYGHAAELSLRHVGCDDPSVTLLHVAIGNNMCSVAAALHMYDDVNAIMEWTQSKSTAIAHCVPFFWCNVIFWKCLSAGPAPAA